MAAMEAAQMMEAKFKAMVDQDVLARQLSGELDTEQKRKKLLDRYGEEFTRKYLAWEDFRFWLVAGA
ncbi:hypothetical protein [Rhizobium sp. 'Codium 1']|uniref:hypothetical protein n=1 Tax=Rhizobium sp. 'Codium 1' TaxID=2940484 RepID=UPI001E38A4A7|nr:hypothetical protein [Rhizobium sp. 'Codium 1']MCC8934792.1 hypothetical protein [Rhizobium sp. 'Codium 1']